MFGQKHTEAEENCWEKSSKRFNKCCMTLWTPPRFPRSENILINYRADKQANRELLQMNV